MWIILNHEHTKLLLKDDEIINYFDGPMWRPMVFTALKEETDLFNV